MSAPLKALRLGAYGANARPLAPWPRSFAAGKVSQWLAWALALALCTLCAPAFAGRSCEAKAPSVASVRSALVLAERTAKALDASGAHVVVLARVGQDLSRYGQRYSHIALAYQDDTDDGLRWRVLHKLNSCGTAQAGVYRQGLGEFFLDDMFTFEAGVVVLDVSVQAKLWALLRDNQRVLRWHESSYSMVAYAWGTRYQQSNQWALETLAGTLDSGATTRERAQAWLKLKGYEPATLHLNAFERLGARITAANVAFDDHPNEKRFSDRIETVTADSVLQWLARSNLGEPAFTVR